MCMHMCVPVGVHVHAHEFGWFSLIVFYFVIKMLCPPPNLFHNHTYLNLSQIHEYWLISEAMAEGIHLLEKRRIT